MKVKLSIFWQGAILTIVIVVFHIIFYVISAFLISSGHLNYPITKPIVFVLSSLLYIPVILFAQKQFKTNLLREFKIPGIYQIVVILAIAVALYVITIPFKNPNDFIKSLLNNKVQIPVFTSPAIDLAFIIYLFHALILGPVLEELFFRGVILKNFLDKYKPTSAILLSSLLFAIAHLRYIDFASLFISGCVFGLMYYKTKSIVGSILLHLIVNLIIKFTIIKEVYYVNNEWIIFLSLYLFCITLIVVFLKYLIKPESKTSIFR